MQITLSTVGYGDFLPSYDISRIAVLLLIPLILMIVPDELNKLGDLLSHRTKYNDKYKKITDSYGHIILLGDVNSSRRLRRFYREFFCESRLELGLMQFEAIAFSEEEPSEEVEYFLMFEVASNQIVYKTGSGNLMLYLFAFLLYLCANFTS